MKLDALTTPFTLKKITPEILAVPHNGTFTILHIYQEAKKSMKNMHIDQWQNGQPNKRSLENDVKTDCLWGLQDTSLTIPSIIAVATLTNYPDPNYTKIEGNWLTHTEKYITIHRIAILNSYKGKQLTDLFIEKAIELANENNCISIRVDTHKDNLPMQQWIKRHGFSYCGIVQVGDGTDRYAYERILPC